MSKTKPKSDALTFHPACLAFPELPEDELQALAADIKKHGLLNDITLLDKQILEGRSRYKACKLARVKPRFVEWAGTGSPTEWVISQNLIRRHLTSSQRAVVALELLPLLEAEAKERKRLSCGRGKKSVQKLGHSSINGRAAESAARITHSNLFYVTSAKTIKKQAPELIDDIRDGRLTIPDANLLAKLPRPQRKGIRRQIEQGKLVNGSVRARIEDELIQRDKVIGPDGKYCPNYWSRTEHPTDRNQNYQTPICAIKPLLKHLPKSWAIWEPCCGGGNISGYLQDQGRTVIATDIKTGHDFLTWQPRKHWDCVVTNPPHRHMTAFLRRCFELKKPFALLLPLSVLEGRERHRLFRDHGVELLMFDRRVEYEPEHNGSQRGDIPFASIWVCHALLPKPLMFVELVE